MLTERDVIRLHQLDKDGRRPCDIANILDCHTQTVYEHLQLRVAYSQKIYQRIGKSPLFISSNVMTIYQAAAYLPGYPSKDKTYRLYRCGVLGSINQPRKHVSLMTNLELIAEAAKKILPETGVWISARTLRCFSVLAASKLVPNGVKLSYWPSRQLYFNLIDAVKSAESYGDSIHVPASIVYRINRILDVCGVATF